ncbi:MAG: hypothetical protein DRQ02_06455 [Candidatus Latescibacterota bacterium]|nr:MAG: hypothetical protein DRQ02_06455 [Candidatus Latescibacterota bacterium]RKY71337.1 MAG: hypothetical protein DRQ24_07600 [Candidatus Latescibacterota bacterium]
MSRILLGLLLIAFLGVLVAGCSHLGPYDRYDLRGVWKGYMVFNDAPKDTTRIQMEVIEQHLQRWDGINIGATGTFTFFMPDGSPASYPLGCNDMGESNKFELSITIERTVVPRFLRGYIFYGNVNSQEISGTYRYFEEGDRDASDPLRIYRREGTWYVARL